MVKSLDIFSKAIMNLIQEEQDCDINNQKTYKALVKLLNFFSIKLFSSHVIFMVSEKQAKVHLPSLI